MGDTTRPPVIWSRDEAPAQPIPNVMERPRHRADRQNGELTIYIPDVAHLVDSINHAKAHGLEAEFARDLLNFLTMALGGCVPRSPGLDGPANGVPGRKLELTISPDSPNTPSFAFSEKVDGRFALSGGLIFWPDSRRWSVHT